MKTISDHVLDLAQNSIAAQSASVEIHVHEDISSNKYAVILKDDGSGISKQGLHKITDPFYTTRTTRKIGLGLSLIKQNVEITGGTFEVRSQKNKGTTVHAVFNPNNIDHPPTGDLPGVIALMVISHPAVKFIYTHTTGKQKDIEYDSSIMPGPIQVNAKNQALIYTMIKDYLQEMHKETHSVE